MKKYREYVVNYTRLGGKEKMNFKNFKLTDKGITLIALVITIVVLLILAGVTIATLTGENGILTKASDASEQTKLGDEKEAIGIAYSGLIAENQGKGEITAEKLKEELIRNGRTDIKNVTGENPITVEFNSGRQYDIDNNGMITENNKIMGNENWYTWEEIENGIKITGFNDEITELRTQIFQEYEELMSNTEGITDEELYKLTFDFMKSIREKIEVKYPGIGNIPSQIDGKNVTEIGSYAFMFMPVKELTIPNTVTNIQPWAFIQGGAKEIIIPSSVKNIGAGSFQTSIVENLIFDTTENIEIGVRAFDSCINLEIVNFKTSNVTVGEKIDYGSIGIFDNCFKLLDNTIQIPQGSRQNFENYTLEQWGLSSYNVFYEE